MNLIAKYFDQGYQLSVVKPCTFCNGTGEITVQRFLSARVSGTHKHACTHCLGGFFFAEVGKGEFEAYVGEVVQAQIAQLAAKMHEDKQGDAAGAGPAADAT